MLYLVHGLKDTFSLASARITDGTCAAADEHIWMMSCQLETFENHERNQMAYMHAVAGWVNAAIDRDGLLSHQVIQALFICLLVYRTTPFEFINNVHKITHLSVFLFSIG